MNQYLEFFKSSFGYIVLVVLIVTYVIMIVKYLSKKTLDGIREDAYKLFLVAEHKYLGTEEGSKKMDYVITMITSMLPFWARIFVSEDFLRKTLEIWFSQIKDLLDDGKLNSSAGKTEFNNVLQSMVQGYDIDADNDIEIEKESDSK